MHTATTRRTTALHTDWSSSWITQRGPGRGGQATSSRTAPPALGLRVTRLDRVGRATRARHRVAPLDSTGKPCCAGWHSRGAASRPATGQTRRRLEPTETVGGRARKGRYPARAGCPHRQLRSRAGRPHERCKARSSRPIDGGAFHAGSHTEPEHPMAGPITPETGGPYPTCGFYPVDHRPPEAAALVLGRPVSHVIETSSRKRSSAGAPTAPAAPGRSGNAPRPGSTS